MKLTRTAAWAAASVVALAGQTASAQMTADQARTAVTPFYNALNGAYIKDAPELIKQSTTPDWVT